jgi:hypothetical protein
MEMVSLIVKIALADSFVPVASCCVGLSKELYEKLINDDDGYCVFWNFMENHLKLANRIRDDQKLLSVDEIK